MFDRVTLLRFFFAVVILTSGVQVLQAMPDDSRSRSTFEAQMDRQYENRDRLAAPRANATAVTTQRGQVIVVDGEGRTIFYNDTHGSYWDVEQIPETNSIVYSASSRVLNSSLCSETPCIENVVERVNVSTGKTTQLYSQFGPRYDASEWHDVDRLDESRLLIGDMGSDQITIVNLTTQTVEWSWNAQSNFSLASAGEYPEDWMHLNDVEQIDRGWFMVSLRNADQVVFVDRTGDVKENWTLGEDGDHQTLYEQHNPDFIPARRGGPALLVADSENNRIVEYHRTNDGDWKRIWQWSKPGVYWPRDADRLQNGNTLISNTRGDSVLEVNRSGAVVWTLPVTMAYDAERLDGSSRGSSGRSASVLDYQNRTASSANVGGSDGTGIKFYLYSLFPNKVVNGVDHVLPYWMRFSDLVMLLIGVGSVAAWTVFELWHRGYRLQTPVRRDTTG